MIGFKGRYAESDPEDRLRRYAKQLRRRLEDSAKVPTSLVLPFHSQTSTGDAQKRKLLPSLEFTFIALLSLCILGCLTVMILGLLP